MLGPPVDLVDRLMSGDKGLEGGPMEGGREIINFLLWLL